MPAHSQAPSAPENADIVGSASVSGASVLSLRELQRAVMVLDQRLSNAWLQRVVQVDGFRLALTFHGSGGTHTFLVSCAPEFARLAALPESPRAPAVPLPFAQYLRARLSRVQYAGGRVADRDRQAALRFRSRDDEFLLVLSILGSRSNMYLLDGTGILLQPMRGLEKTRVELAVGKAWIDPPSVLRSKGTDRWETVSDENYLEAIQKTYAALELRNECDILARRLELALRREVASLERKATNLSEDLGEAVRAEEYRKKGELLKGVLHAVRPGDRVARATDHEAGAEIVIPLDPLLSPSANLEAYFKRYQKEQRGVEAIRQQLALLGNNQAVLASQQEKLRELVQGGVQCLSALRAFAEQPAIRKLTARRYPHRAAVRLPRSTAGRKAAVPSRLVPRRFRGDHGLEIWVGRSDEGNDYLTTRLARGNDLFFHLEGYPGSHVILRTEGRKDPPSDAILDACELAVHYSKLKEASRADVHVAPVKNVKRPKSARAGLIYVTKGRTVHLRRDPKRLRNILASRMED